MKGSRTARAFAPAHVTGLFAPATAGREPRARGSRGAGVVLDIGALASVEWRPGPCRSVRVLAGGAEPLPISIDVAERLLGERAGSLTVRLHHDLPIGQGFGMSAAGAAATALAVSGALGLPRAHALEIAHLGDLFGGGGLGGVASILDGGIEFRRTPGIPPFGDIRRLAWEPTVFVGVVGDPLPSPPRLRDERFLARVTASSVGLEALLARPDPTRFFRLSERFTERMNIASPRLRGVLRDLRADGAWAFQAMFGESFLAAPRTPPARARVIRGLRANRVRALEVRVAGLGARRLAPRPSSRAKHTQPF